MNEILNNVDTASLAVGTAFAVFIGAVAKKIDQFPNKYIPHLCAVVGGIVVGWEEGFELKNIAAGLVAGFGGTGLHQGFKQFFSDENK